MLSLEHISHIVINFNVEFNPIQDGSFPGYSRFGAKRPPSLKSVAQTLQ